MTPHVRKTDHVTDDLLHRIVAGELAVGDVLPREEELADHYDVNRSVIRESIKLLEVHRLVRPVRRRGTEVLDAMESLSPEVVRAMLIPQPGRLNQKMLANVLELRAFIDKVMTERAAERRSEADVAAMRDCVARMRKTLYDPINYSTAMNDLAVVIARSTGNCLFEMLVHWHRRVHSDLEALFVNVRMASPPHLQGIEAMVLAIDSGDAAAAGRLVQAFHEWAGPRLLAAAQELGWAE